MEKNVLFGETPNERREIKVAAAVAAQETRCQNFMNTAQS